MGTTPLHQLPYPEPTDEPYVHQDLRRLAESVDEVLPVAQDTAPPHKLGRVWTRTDGTTSVSNGVAWLPLFVDGPAGQVQVANAKRTTTTAMAATTLTPSFKCDLYLAAYLSVGFASADAEVGVTWAKTSSGSGTLSAADTARVFAHQGRWAALSSAAVIRGVAAGDQVAFRMAADVASADTEGAYYRGALHYRLVPRA